MFKILCWIIYALFVGLIAKAIHPGTDPRGFLPTLGIGIAGSFIGGLINSLLGWGSFLAPSGILMGIVGAVIFCWVYRKYRLNFLGESKDLIGKGR